MSSPAAERPVHRRVRAGLLAVAVVALLETSVAGGFSELVLAGSATPATPPAATPRPKSLAVSATHAGPLSPGTVRPVRVTVTNEHPGDVRLVRVVPTIATGKGGLPAGCAADQFVLNGYEATASAPGPLLTKHGGQATVELTVGMTARSSAQDGCKGLQFTIDYTATGQGK